jgi:hypothetical protein
MTNLQPYVCPTDEQLERFVQAMLAGEARRRGIDIDPAAGARMVMRVPVLKENWLRRWECPKCGTVNAPWRVTCAGCRPRPFAFQYPKRPVRDDAPERERKP